MTKSKGHLKFVSTLASGKYQVLFELDKPITYKHDDLLNIEVKKYRKGRSLNANAYFHVLNDKLSEVLTNTRNAQKNILMGRYGAIDKELGAILQLDEIDYLELENLHLRPTDITKTFESGKLYRAYQVLKPTHLYDSKEMARLIDGTVSECKEVGIDTMTTRELEEMKDRWNV